MFLAKIPPNPDLPIALAKWYDYTKWVLDRVEGLPKNQETRGQQRMALT